MPPSDPRFGGHHPGHDDGWDDGWDGGEPEWDGEPADGGEWDGSDEPEEVEPASGPMARVPVGEHGPQSSGAHWPLVAATENRRRRRGTRRRVVARRVAWVVAVVGVLVGLVLASAVVLPGLWRPPATPVPVAAPAVVPVEAAFGGRVERPDGWTVAVDVPRAVRDLDDLPEDAVRGVVIDVVLTNTAGQPRDTAGWMVKAVVGDSPVEVDPGIVPSRTVRSGASLAFPVTVPMPKGPTDLQLEAAPPGAVSSLFVGTS